MKAYGREWDVPRCPIHGVEMVPYIYGTGENKDQLVLRCPRECNEEGPLPEGFLEHVQVYGPGYESVWA